MIKQGCKTWHKLKILRKNEFLDIVTQQHHGGHGVEVTQRVVVPLSWVRFPLATPSKIEPEMARFLFWLRKLGGSSRMTILDTPNKGWSKKTESMDKIFLLTTREFGLGNYFIFSQVNPVYSASEMPPTKVESRLMSLVPTI